MDVRELRNSLQLGDCFVIGYVGRLLQMKGIDTILEAVAHLVSRDATYSYRLLIVGQGEDKLSFQKTAETLGISEQIVWIDAVPPEEVAAYINCMDTLVLPSRTTAGWVEFFGRVLIEGMACEVPVIGSDSGEIPHVIDDAGLVFPEDDMDTLAEQIHRIAHDVRLREDLVARGLSRIEDFTWETIAERTYQVYQELLEDAS